MTQFTLQFSTHNIEELSNRYAYENDDGPLLERGKSIRSRGFFTKNEFLKFCKWKSQRTRKHYRSNSSEFVEEVTRIALSTSVEQLRIEVLLLLAGLRWSTASTLLHFAHPDPYPIYDYRALEALGIEKSYQTENFDFWWDYTRFCRQLAQDVGVSMRVLDRALWQYSKETIK